MEGWREGGGGAQRCSKWQDQQIGKHFSLSFHLLSCSPPLQLHHCCPRFYDKSDSLRRLLSRSSLPPSLSSSLWISPLSRYASDDSSLRARGTHRQEMLLFLFAPLRKNRYGKTNTNADDPVVAFSSFHLSTAYPAGSRGQRGSSGGGEEGRGRDPRMKSTSVRSLAATQHIHFLRAATALKTLSHGQCFSAHGG